MPAEAYASLHEALRHAVADGLGWRELRPIQEATLLAARSGRDLVVVAPTAGGKTEAALLPILDSLLRRPVQGTGALYVCPLRALLNNLEPRVAHLCGLVGLAAFKWHGDVEDARKRGFLKDPADLLMTTPESLEAMLLSSRVDVRSLFSGVRFAVVDEVHAFAADDRGAHLLSVLERLEARTERRFQRLALSATVGNPEALGKWLVGASGREAQVVRPERAPSQKELRVFAVPPDGAFASIAAQEAAGKKTLLFVESRHQAEAAAAALRERQVPVFVHHSSVARESRAEAERAFAEAETGTIVATSTLELGIDVGDLDLVQQLGAPRTVSSFLQRLGRTGRRGGRARMSFFTSDDFELVQAIALIELAKQGWVEPIAPSHRSWHVLAHQVIASALERPGVLASELWEVLRRAAPFSEIGPDEYLELVRHLSALGVLHASGGTVALGPEGERRFGARNYFDLFAVFEGARSIQVKTESGEDVGTLQTSFILGQPPGFAFILAGRVWEIVSGDVEKGLITARPAKRGRLPRWLGFPTAGISRRIAEEHRKVLAGGEPFPYAIGAAGPELARIRSEWQGLAEGSAWPLIQRDGALALATFAGFAVNLTLARALAERLGWACVPDSYQVGIRSPSARAEALRDELGRLTRDGLEPDLVARMAAPLAARPLSRFQKLLPEPRSLELVAERLLAVGDARDQLRDRTFPSITVVQEPAAAALFSLSGREEPAGPRRPVPALDAWRVQDVSGWEQLSQEPRGKREKFWFQGPDRAAWLRKYPRESRPYEPAIEATVLRLARAVGVEAAEGHAASWEEGRRGIVVRTFIDEERGESLSLGVDVMRGNHPEYDPSNHAQHTLELVFDSLAAVERRFGASDLQVRFADMVIFDAWIGNNDRHQENWGILVRAGAPPRLSPMFDPAACLGSELQDGHVLLRPSPPDAAVRKYIENCRSGFGDGQHKELVSQTAVVQWLRANLSAWDETIRTWLSKFEEAVPRVEQFLGSVPDDWFPPARRALALRLLRERLAWLKERANAPD